LRNDLTDKQIMLKDHELGDLNERSRIYQQIQAVMVSDSGNDLDVAMSDFFNAFSELSNNPQDSNLRDVVVSKAQSLTSMFQNTAGDLKDIKDRVFDSAQTRVDRVNTLLTNLADVNSDIARAEATGHSDLGSKDQQTELLKKLSNLVTVDTNYNNDGTVEARIGGIVVLNDQKVSKIKAETDPTNNVFRLRLDNGKLLDPGKGALAADIYMYEEGIPEMSQKLDKIAGSVVSQVNAIHSNGYGLSDSVQRNFFNPSNTTAESISLNSDIVSNPDHIAASSVPGESGNNDNALLIGDLRNLSILDGKTLNNNIIEMLSSPGLKLNRLEQNINSKESAKQLLVNQQQSQSGVNVDEELSNLIKYQNAYQASAKVLNVGQRMYDTLLGII
ncbi:MAG: flagellar hook-associated protein FlgK, partial [Balneolaceae bacterium]